MAAYKGKSSAKMKATISPFPYCGDHRCAGALTSTLRQFFLGWTHLARRLTIQNAKAMSYSMRADDCLLALHKSSARRYYDHHTLWDRTAATRCGESTDGAVGSSVKKKPISNAYLDHRMPTWNKGSGRSSPNQSFPETNPCKARRCPYAVHVCFIADVPQGERAS